MIFAYRHKDGRVVLTTMPSEAELEQKPYVSEVLKEMPRLPDRGEKLDEKTLEIVAAEKSVSRDALSDLDELKARVAALEAGQ